MLLKYYKDNFKRSSAQVSDGSIFKIILMDWAENLFNNLINVHKMERNAF